MRFESLHLKAFGGFTDHLIRFADEPHQFHIIHGANESGKSTSLRAITALLYGFDPRTADDYVHPMSALRVGGTLVDQLTDRRLELVRRKGTRRTLLTPDEADEVPEQSLIDMMGGVSKQDFQTRFGLSHDELVAGGQAILKGEGDLGEILFAAGAGIGKLRQIQEQIEKEAGEWFKPRASNPSINRAISQLSDKRKELRQRQVPTARYRSLRSDLNQADEQAAEATSRVTEAAGHLERLRATAKALPLLPAWRAAEAADEATSAVVSVDESFTTRRREASEKLALASERTAELTRRLDEVRSRRDQHPPDGAIVSVRSEIESLFAEKAAVEKGVIDRDNLLSHRQRGLRQLVKSLGELSIDVGGGGGDDELIERISDANLDSIKFPIPSGGGSLRWRPSVVNC